MDGLVCFEEGWFQENFVEGFGRVMNEAGDMKYQIDHQKTFVKYLIDSPKIDKVIQLRLVEGREDPDLRDMKKMQYRTKEELGL